MGHEEGADAEATNRKFSLEIDGKQVAAEVFCRAGKALTVTGVRIGEARALADTRELVGWAIAWGEREKAASEARKPNGHAPLNGARIPADRRRHHVDQVIRGAPAGENRSDTFHAIVGHLFGCARDAAAIAAKLRQHPDGVGARYIAEGRLEQEIARSAKKFAKDALPAFAGFAPIVTPAAKPAPSKPAHAPTARAPQRPAPSDALRPDDELADPDPADAMPAGEATPLPELFAYGGKAGRQAEKTWLLKGLMPAVGHGLLSGQWGSFKTFVALELAASDHDRRTLPRAPGETEIRRAPDRGMKGAAKSNCGLTRSLSTSLVGSRQSLSSGTAKPRIAAKKARRRCWSRWRSKPTAICSGPGLSLESSLSTRSSPLATRKAATKTTQARLKL